MSNYIDFRYHPFSFDKHEIFQTDLLAGIPDEHQIQIVKVCGPLSLTSELLHPIAPIFDDKLCRC